MENRNNKPYQHLSLQDRYDIEEGLNRNYSFSRIADMLRRDRTTISKEVFKRSTFNFSIFPSIFPLNVFLNRSIFAEFKNPVTLETCLEGALRTKLFFCDPPASWQKRILEKNHEYIRKIIPKGISLTNYTPQDITLMANHINSTARASLNGRTPFKLAQLLLDSRLIEILHLHAIESGQIILTP